MLNSERNINVRLLRLFPVKVLKENFEVEGSQYDLVRQIAVDCTTDEIIDFASHYTFQTKQHIYIYTFNHAFNRLTFNTANNPFPLPIIREATLRGGGHVFYCLPETIFTASIRDLATNAVEDESVTFKQPITIKITANNIIIHATKIERSIAAYMETESKAYGVKKTPDDDFVSQIIDYFTQLYNGGVTRCNINTGVKFLCDNNTVGIKYIQTVTVESVDTSTMNGEYNYKDAFPDKYDELMQFPIDKIALKYRGNDKRLCDKFVAEPNIGKLNVTSYPDDTTQIAHVVNQILANN